jgi:hypothetical protein
MALEKLSIMRLNSGDIEGAVVLMEKLVKLHPDRQNYKIALAGMKKKMEQ